VLRFKPKELDNKITNGDYYYDKY